MGSELPPFSTTISLWILIRCHSLTIFDCWCNTLKMTHFPIGGKLVVMSTLVIYLHLFVTGFLFLFPFCHSAAANYPLFGRIRISRRLCGRTYWREWASKNTTPDLSSLFCLILELPQRASHCCWSLWMAWQHIRPSCFLRSCFYPLQGWLRFHTEELNSSSGPSVCISVDEEL